MADLKAPEKTSSNRPSLIVIIGAVATLIGALVGLMNALHTMGWVGTKAPDPRPTVVVVPNSPTSSEVLALQNQLREVTSQLASMSLKASSLPRTAATAASAAVATQHLALAADKAKKLERDLSLLQASAALPPSAQAPAARPPAAEAPATQASAGEKNIEFEIVKSEMKKLSDMQNEMSNVLKTMDEMAKEAIRKIKA